MGNKKMERSGINEELLGEDDDIKGFEKIYVHERLLALIEDERNKMIKNPWGEFLDIRVKVIKWMTEEMEYNDREIASTLSMDARQVYLIKESYKDIENERYEKKMKEREAKDD